MGGTRGQKERARAGEKANPARIFVQEAQRRLSRLWECFSLTGLRREGVETVSRRHSMNTWCQQGPLQNRKLGQLHTALCEGTRESVDTIWSCHGSSADQFAERLSLKIEQQFLSFSSYLWGGNRNDALDTSGWFTWDMGAVYSEELSRSTQIHECSGRFQSIQMLSLTESRGTEHCPLIHLSAGASGMKNWINCLCIVTSACARMCVQWWKSGWSRCWRVEGEALTISTDKLFSSTSTLFPIQARVIIVLTCSRERSLPLNNISMSNALVHANGEGEVKNV